MVDRMHRAGIFVEGEQGAEEAEEGGGGAPAGPKPPPPPGQPNAAQSEAEKQAQLAANRARMQALGGKKQ